MLKKSLLTLVLLFSSLYAYDTRLNSYPEVKAWLKDADTHGESAYNIGVIYHQNIKDNEKAIEWYKKAFKMDDKGASRDSAHNLGYVYSKIKKNKEAIMWYKTASALGDNEATHNLGLLYSKKLHQYDDAIFYYKKAYDMGNMEGAHSIAFIYQNTLNKPNKAIEWYKKAAKGGYVDSIKNLARYYKLDKNDNVMGGAYFIALIDLKYPKQKVITYLKTKWNLTDEELEKAYKLQQTLDIPKHYTGGIEK